MTYKHRGFTLFEVTLSCILISVAALGLLKLQVSLEQKAVFTLHQVEALHFAERQLELFRTRASNISGSTGLIAFSQLGLPAYCGQGISQLSGSIYTLNCKVENVAGVLDGELKKVTVMVSWNKRIADSIELSPSHALSLTTYLSKYSEFDL
ncbi:type IV pilin [Vibrio kasasachensis]|uniref:type IV pilus modification PilV family protein n=1 Tax=Vibrio kasasachensis TaxID=2910248 RepID=UPI003D11F8F2